MYVALFATRVSFSRMSVMVMLGHTRACFLMHAFCLSMCRPRVRSLVLLVSVCLPLSVCFCLFRCVVASVFDLVFAGRFFLALWGTRLLEVTTVPRDYSFRYGYSCWM